MISLSEVSTNQFHEALTTSAVRTSQVIYIALAAGTSMFAFTVLLVYATRGGEGSTANYPLANILSAVHVGLFILAWIAGKWLSERQFSEHNLRSGANRTFTDKDSNPIDMSPAQKCLSIIRTGSLIRLATLEGAAFFGLAASMVTITNGVALLHPTYLLNMTSAAFLVTYIAMTFPTAEKLETTFKKYFHHQ